MTEPVEDTPEERTSSRFITQRKFAAAGLAAGLIGGGAAGILLTDSPLSGAESVSVTEADDSTDDAAEHAPRLEEHIGEVLAPLVDDGTINQEQADAVKAALLEAAPERPRGPRGKAWVALKSAAEVIGVEPRELADALRDGSTIAEVAAEHGVEVQSVIDAMVAEATERLNEAVADGRITEEQAARRLEGLTERVTDRVNNGFPRGGPGHHGPGGVGGDGAEGGGVGDDGVEGGGAEGDTGGD